MTKIVLREKDEHSRFTFYGIIFIVFIHIIGYIKLREWLYFSGIGEDATRIENQYGYTGLIFLNLSAVLAFTLLAYLYQLKSRGRWLYLISQMIVYIFIFRGILGYLLMAIQMIGTATPFWEFVFSTLALSIGVSGLVRIGD